MNSNEGYHFGAHEEKRETDGIIMKQIDWHGSLGSANIQVHNRIDVGGYLIIQVRRAS